MILCCGEALIDMMPGRTGKGRDAFVPRCGGAALNSAIALAGQGVRTGLLTGMSSDRFGRQLDKELVRAGVDRTLIVRSERPTTLAFVHPGGEEAEYTFHDEGSAGRMLTPDDLPPLPDHVCCLLMGGISLCHSPAADAYEALVMHAGGRLVMLDPNIRPRLADNGPGYRERLWRMIGRAQIVKLSGADLDWIDPRPLPWRVRVARLFQEGTVLVLFTRGAKGAVACHGDGREVVVAAHKIVVADTVGAGDAFNAGFLAQLEAEDYLNLEAIRNIPSDILQGCLERAVRVAAEALSRPAEG